MRSRFLRALSLLLLALIATLTCPAYAQVPKDFIGTWVMTLASKPFLVLYLAPAADAPVSGYLLRPSHFQTSDGLSFSNIGNTVSRRPIVRSSLQNGALRITVANPSKPDDTDDFDMRLKDASHMAMTIVGSPLEPRVFVRIAQTAGPATDWDEHKTYSDEDAMVTNPEMTRIFDADQKDRQPEKIDWSVVSKADEQRRQQTRKLLADGELHTGEDFEHAAFVFQHGSTPNDYLLAHTLAMVAVKKGQSEAIWIAAATLDRYLQSVKQPQIFGTQYHIPRSGPVTQDPYDRELVSDPLRRQLGVPSQAVQQLQLKQYEAEQKAGK
jgi:hypothetical protein